MFYRLSHVKRHTHGRNPVGRAFILWLVIPSIYWIKLWKLWKAGIGPFPSMEPWRVAQLWNSYFSQPAPSYLDKLWCTLTFCCAHEVKGSFLSSWPGWIVWGKGEVGIILVGWLYGGLWKSRIYDSRTSRILLDPLDMTENHVSLSPWISVSMEDPGSDLLQILRTDLYYLTSYPISPFPSPISHFPSCLLQQFKCGPLGWTKAVFPPLNRKSTC